MAFDTAANIIGNAAVELGLTTRAAVNGWDPFASTDPNVGQLCALLTTAGRDLVRRHEWSTLTNTWLFQTVTNQGFYGLPVDLDRILDQTGWNRTNRLPLGGPVSPQAFEFLKARLVGVTWNLLWRLLQGNFQAYPDDVTPGSYAIAYEYVGRWWAIAAGTQAVNRGPWTPNVAYSSLTPDYVVSGGRIYKCTTSGQSGTTAAPAGTGAGIVDGTCVWQHISVAGQDSTTAKGDVLQFDPQLLKSALKLAWKKEKGFDATAAQADFDHDLEMALNADILAPVLSFSVSQYQEPLLSLDNLPLAGVAH